MFDLRPMRVFEFVVALCRFEWLMCDVGLINSIYGALANWVISNDRSNLMFNGSMLYSIEYMHI